MASCAGDSRAGNTSPFLALPRPLPPLDSTQLLLVTSKRDHGTWPPKWPPRVTTTARRSVTMTTLDQPSEPTRGGEASHYFLPRATHMIAFAPPA
jgi:hypothetical protein